MNSLSNFVVFILLFLVGNNYYVLAGGCCNTISGYQGFIGVGWCNTVSAAYNHSSIVGGNYNIVSANCAAILGGCCNVILAGHDWSTVAGCNVITNQACAFHANILVSQNMPVHSVIAASGTVGYFVGLPGIPAGYCVLVTC